MITGHHSCQRSTKWLGNSVGSVCMVRERPWVSSSGQATILSSLVTFDGSVWVHG